MNVTTNHNTSDTQTPPSSHHFLPAGTIAGIVTAAVLSTFLVLAFAVFLIRRSRRRTAVSVASREEMSATMYRAAEIDGRKLYPDGMVEMPGDQPS